MHGLISRLYMYYIYLTIYIIKGESKIIPRRGGGAVIMSVTFHGCVYLY